MNGSQTTPPRVWRDQLAMALLVAAADWLSVTLARGPGELAAMWISNGIIVGWLLSRSTRLWPGYVLAGLGVDVAARMLSGDQALQAIPIGISNLVEVLLVAGTVRHVVPDVGDPRRWISLGGIATASTLVACAVSGGVAAAVTTALHGSSFGLNFITWYAAHVVGMVIFATGTLVVHREGRDLFSAQGRRWSLVGTTLLTAAVSVAVFLSPYPVLFLTYPPLLFAAFKHRFAGTTLGVLVLVIVGSTATALGRGPLWLVQDIATPGRIALLQLYIVGACLLTIPVALAMSERKRLTAHVRESEHRYRMLADYSHDVVARMNADGDRLYVSPSAADILGWTPAEMLGSRWSLVHPDDRERQAQDMAGVIGSGQPHTAIYRVQHKDGHYVWIEAVTRPIPSVDGEGVDIIYAGRDISRRVAAEQALEASRQELERLARVDALTGLANRRQFDERLSLALARLKRHGAPIAVLYLDIDHFKAINDTYGHAAGDEILRSFATRLTSCVRVNDLVSRLGGDEFVVLIEDAVLPSAAEAVAQKLIAEMDHAITVGSTTHKVTTSIGIGYATTETDAITLMATADAALYAAKGAGRNTYRVQPANEAPAGGGAVVPGLSTTT